MTLIQQRLVGLGALLVMGALGTVAVLWQVRHTEEKQEEKKAADKLLHLDKAENVATLTLDTPAGHFVVVRRDTANPEQTWQLTSPIDTLAEKTTIDGILSQLAALTRTREVGETLPDKSIQPPTDLKLFELDPPRFTVAVDTTAGEHETLLVGKKSTFDGSLFVKVDGKPAVSVVPGTLEYQVDRDLLKLREKRLAIFDSAAVSALEVTYRQADLKDAVHYRIEKQGEEFQLTSPRPMAADTTQVTGILSALTGARAKSFVCEHATPEEVRAHGLDRPSAQVQLSFASGAPVTLLYSEVKAGAETHTYAMQAGAGPILELGSEWGFKKAMSRPDDLRDKRVLKLDRDQVRGLTIVKGTTELSFARREDAQTKALGWSMTAPVEQAVSEPTLLGLLYTLSSLKGERVLAEAATDAEWTAHGLDQPELRVTLRGEGDKELGTILVGNEQDGGRVIGTSASRRLDIVDGSRVNDISVNPDDYKDKSGGERP